MIEQSQDDQIRDRLSSMKNSNGSYVLRTLRQVYDIRDNFALSKAHGTYGYGYSTKAIYNDIELTCALSKIPKNEHLSEHPGDKKMDFVNRELRIL